MLCTTHSNGCPQATRLLRAPPCSETLLPGSTGLTANGSSDKWHSTAAPKRLQVIAWDLAAFRPAVAIGTRNRACKTAPSDECRLGQRQAHGARNRRCRNSARQTRRLRPDRHRLAQTHV